MQSFRLNKLILGVANFSGPESSIPRKSTNALHDFFLLFFFLTSIDGVKLGKGPDVPWGIFFAQATVGSLLGNFMTSPGSATAAAGPPQR